MYSANILGNWHLMIGSELHYFWLSGSPVPAPPPAVLNHISSMILNGTGLTASKTTNVQATNNKIIHQGSDIGNFILHVNIPPAPINLFLPLHIAFSGSKSMFGVNTVIAEDNPVGVAVAVIMNFNLNCSDPVYLPGGVVYAFPMTCQAGFTLADFLGGLMHMAFDMAISYAINKFFRGKWGQKFQNAFFFRVFSPMFRGFVRVTGKTPSFVAAHLFSNFSDKVLENIVVGTPLGWSANPATDSFYAKGGEITRGFFTEDTETLSSN